MMQWNCIGSAEFNFNTSSLILATTPVFLPTIFLAPSVVTLFNLSQLRLSVFRASHTFENKLSAVVVSFRLCREHSSSVITKLESMPLMKTSSCAVSTISLLSSNANEKYSKHLALSVNMVYSCSPMSSTRLVMVDADKLTLLMQDNLSGHISSTTFPKHFFTNSPSVNG